MAQSTDEAMVEALRFRGNVEQTDRNANDEARIQEIAEFIMATAEEFQNEAVASQMRDVANQLVTNKSDLARTPDQSVSEAPEEQGGLPPDAAAIQAQQALLAQQQAGPGQPGIPPA